ncbi:adenosine kinase [Candidatus Woesearchaeota archaeon]|nr:adenosine kinase [Candidatus Woesearchaeota archaeon]
MEKDVVALTNAVTDVFFRVTDDELAALGLRKGHANAISKKAFYASPKFRKLMKKDKLLIPGGSPANVVQGTAALGRKSGLIGTVGDDEVGLNYLNDVKNNGLKSLLTIVPGAESGVCYVMVTPNGEKTPMADLKISKEFHVNHKKINDYKIFHTSGYELLSNPEVMKDTLAYAKSKGLKISFDIADPAVPKKMRNDLEEVLKQVDYLTMTEDELRAYVEEEELEKAIKKIQGLYNTEIIAVKKGKEGSELLVGNERIIIPKVPCKVVNTTGAGDTYSAGLLTGILLGWSLESSARLGSYVAAQVCSQEGARLIKPKVKKLMV